MSVQQPTNSLKAEPETRLAKGVLSHILMSRTTLLRKRNPILHPIHFLLPSIFLSFLPTFFSYNPLSFFLSFFLSFHKALLSFFLSFFLCIHSFFLSFFPKQSGVFFWSVYAFIQFSFLFFLLSFSLVLYHLFVFSSTTSLVLSFVSFIQSFFCHHISLLLFFLYSILSFINDFFLPFFPFISVLFFIF